MDGQDWTTLAAVAVSVVALCTAVLLAVSLGRTRRAVADLRTDIAASRDLDPGSGSTGGPSSSVVEAPVPRVTSLRRRDDVDPSTGLADELVVLTRDGRTIVMPTTERIVDATFGRPLVRGATLSYGLAHALRSQSRDRISSLVRREFRRRRKDRLRAGRRAVRTAQVQPAPPPGWLSTPPPGGRQKADR